MSRLPPPPPPRSTFYLARALEHELATATGCQWLSGLHISESSRDGIMTWIMICSKGFFKKLFAGGSPGGTRLPEGLLSVTALGIVGGGAPSEADSAKTRTLSVMALIPKLPLAC